MLRLNVWAVAGGVIVSVFAIQGWSYSSSPVKQQVGHELNSAELASIRVGASGISCTGGDVIKVDTVCARPKTTCVGENDYFEVNAGGEFTVPGSGGIKIKLPNDVTVARVSRGCKATAIEAGKCDGEKKEYADPAYPNATGTMRDAVSTECTKTVASSVCRTTYADQIEYYIYIPTVGPDGNIRLVKKVIWTANNPFPFPIGCELAGLEPRPFDCFAPNERFAKYTKECIDGELEDRRP